MRGRGNSRGGVPAKPRERLHFDEDFDFESANALFNKEDLEKELREKLSLGESNDKAENGEGSDAGSENGESESFYDKDNFFDNISCEASDREKGKRTRPNWKEERKTNTETFGLNSTRDLRYYGRGGMRGRGGGMYRGGRGGPRGGGGWGPRGGSRGGGNWRGRNNNRDQRGEDRRGGRGGGRPQSDRADSAPTNSSAAEPAPQAAPAPAPAPPVVEAAA